MIKDEEIEEEYEKCKCGRCKVLLPRTHFSKLRSGNYRKNCEQCLETQREYRKKNKCEHGRRKYQCKECGGSS